MTSVLYNSSTKLQVLSALIFLLAIAADILGSDAPGYNSTLLAFTFVASFYETCPSKKSCFIRLSTAILLLTSIIFDVGCLASYNYSFDSVWSPIELGALLFEMIAKIFIGSWILYQSPDARSLGTAYCQRFVKTRVRYFLPSMTKFTDTLTTLRKIDLEIFRRVVAIVWIQLVTAITLGVLGTVAWIYYGSTAQFSSVYVGASLNTTIFVKALTSFLVVAAAFTNLDMEAVFEPFGCLKILSGRKISATYEMGFVTHKEKQVRRMTAAKILDCASGAWCAVALVAGSSGVPLLQIFTASIPPLVMLAVLVSDVWVPVLFLVLYRLKAYRNFYGSSSNAQFSNMVLGQGTGSDDYYDHMDAADDEKFDAIYHYETSSWERYWDDAHGAYYWFNSQVNNIFRTSRTGIAFNIFCYFFFFLDWRESMER